MNCYDLRDTLDEQHSLLSVANVKTFCQLAFGWDDWIDEYISSTPVIRSGLAGLNKACKHDALIFSTYLVL